MIVDSHVHVWEASSILYQVISSLGLPQGFDAPAERLLEEMAASGVDRAVLVQPSNYEFDNRYLASCLRCYPGRFAGVGRIDEVDASAPRRLALWTQNYGLEGLRIVPFRIFDGSWVNSPYLSPLWHKIREFGIPLCFQIGRGQLGALARLLERFAQDFPELKLVIDHMGHPVVEEGPGGSDFRELLALARYENIDLKISGHYALSRESYPYRDTFPLMQAIYEHFGPQRMLWGSDFPYILGHCGYRQALALIQQLPFLSQEDKEWVLGKTALSLWQFDSIP